LHKNELVLGDLGLAKDISIITRASLTTGIGTYPYMSPEVATETKNYTNKIDIWYKKIKKYLQIQVFLKHFKID